MTSIRIARVLTIVKIILIYGLDEFIPKSRLNGLRILRWCLFWWRNQHADKSTGDRLKLALVELGPIFVKFGQLMATRQDILPPDMIGSLQTLQDKVPPFDSKQSMKIIEDNMPFPLDKIFSEVSPDPVASASIAQVHFAILQPKFAQRWSLSNRVVIKVVRPGIEEKIRRDIILLRWLGSKFEQLHVDGKRLKPLRLVDDYEQTIMQELDMAKEAANTIKLRKNAETIDKLYVPAVFEMLSNRHVMVLERIEGIPVNDIDALIAAGTNLEKLADAGTSIFFTQVFRDSFFHADMHAGNIFVDVSNPDDPSYIGIDCGICGTLGKQDKRYLAENLLAFFNQDYRRVAELHVNSGWVNPATDVGVLTRAIEEVCAPIFGKPLSEIAMGDFLLELFNTARQFEMEVQPQLVLLQKTLLYIEGLGRKLYPELDLWTTAKPFLEQWIHQQFGAKATWDEVKAHGPEWRMTLPEIPQRLHAYLHREPLQTFQTQQLIQKVLEQNQAQNTRMNRLITAVILLIASQLVQQNFGFAQWVEQSLLILGIIVALSGWLMLPRFKKMGSK
jgi:ubiquinone biosynthesis protein